MNDLLIDPMPGIRALIIGGLGFIGSNLAHRLVGLGAEVTILDACLDPYGWNVANLDGIDDQVRLIVGDVRNFDLLRSLVRDQDLIFNFAGQVGRTISIENPWLDTDINCIGALNVLEACRRYNPSAKVIFSGSRGQVGEPVYLPVDEDHPDNPTDIYGINKLAVEQYHLLYHRVHGLRTVSLRFNNVYGPRCQMKHGHYGVVNLFIRYAMTGQPIPVYGDGTQTRDYIYIDDVVDAVLLAAQRAEADGEVFLVGSGREVVFRDMVRLVIESVGRGEYVHVPFPPDLAKIDIDRFVISFAKLQRLLGWAPRVDLDEGLRCTAAFYRERLPLYLEESARPISRADLAAA